jgi:6,7-dimethyl-8-ribityllumazine synthase
VIKGETPHFNFICDAVANGISQITIEQNIPIGFGVLTTSNKQQAIERAGGDHGHKGEEAAWTVLKLLERQ